MTDTETLDWLETHQNYRLLRLAATRGGMARCPSGNHPVFIRPSGSIVAHTEASGRRCPASETKYEEPAISPHSERWAIFDGPVSSPQTELLSEGLTIRDAVANAIERPYKRGARMNSAD